MKKIVFFVCVFSLLGNMSWAQWQPYLGFPLSMGGPHDGYADFQAGNVCSLNSAMCAMGHYYSPSFGQALWLKATNDGGATWTGVYSDYGQGISTISIETVRKQNTYYHIRNWQGWTNIERTFSNGLSWRHVGGTTSTYVDFAVVDTAHFFLLYRSYTDNYSYLDKYANKTTFYRIDTITTERPQSLFFPDTSIGYMACSTPSNLKCHLILKTTTAGTNWFQVYADSLVNIRKMYFPSVMVGYALCDSGKIIKTLDGGYTWNNLNSGTSVSLRSIYFANDTLGLAAGDSGTILRTTNGGISWHKDSVNTTSSFDRIFFINDTIGMAISGQVVFSTYVSPLNIDNVVPSEFLIYPNPTFGQLKLQIPQQFGTITSLKIFDCLGRLLLEKHDNFSEIDMSALNNGIYFLVVANSENTRLIKKIVKE